MSTANEFTSLFLSSMEEAGLLIPETEEEETEEERLARLAREAEEAQEAERLAKEEQEEEILAEQEKAQEAEVPYVSTFISSMKEKNLLTEDKETPEQRFLQSTVSQSEKEKTIPETPEGAAYSLKRKMAYGAAQETTILRNLYSLGKAGWVAVNEGKSYKRVAREIEKERQRAISKRFPELIKLQEDGAVFAGRMSVAIADPVTWLVPWTKIAKFGKLAVAGTGAAVGMGDIALREHTLYGSVNPMSVMLAGGLGAGGSVLGSFISPIGKRTEDLVEAVGTTSKKGAKKTTREGQLNLFEVDELTEESVIQNSKYITGLLDADDNLGDLWSQLNVLRTTGLHLSDDLQKLESELVKMVKKGRPTELRETAKIQTQKLIKDNNKTIEKTEIELDKLLLEKVPELTAENSVNNFKIALEKGVMSTAMAQALMQESIRPLIGTIGGFAVGVTTADENDTMDYVYRWMMAGAFLGFTQKRIQNSSWIKTKQDKAYVDAFIKEGQDTYKRGFGVTLKRLTAGTHAAKLQAGVEAVRRFGSQMFKLQGAEVATGSAQKLAVEESKQISLNYWTSVALPEIMEDVNETTLLAAGRIVNQKGMQKGSKHSFLQQGDLENFEAQSLANKIIHLQDEFKKYVKGSGIDFKEEDAYGLTQLIKEPELIYKNKGNLENAFKIQFLNDYKLGRLKRASDSSGNVFYVHKSDFTDVEWSSFNDIIEDVTKLKRKYTLKQVDDALKNGKWFNNWAGDQADNYISGVTNSRSTSLWAFADDATVSSYSTKAKLFKSRGNEEEDLIITAARHFDNERVLYDQEARAYMASKDFFDDDPISTMLNLFEQTVPVVEFARVFGARGEGIRKIFKDIKNQIITDPSNVSLQNIAKTQIKDVKDSVDAYFGLYGAQYNQFNNSEWGKASIAVLQALLSTTKLTKVAIPSLGDLVQVWQNTGSFGTAMSLIRRKNGSWRPSNNLGYGAQRPKDLIGAERVWKNRRYNGLLEREMKSWTIEASTGPGIAQSVTRGAAEFQRRFFETVGLGRVTRFAREFAYDAGAIRAWKISQKIGKTGKISNSLQKEIDGLGLTVDNIRYLSKFKNMDAIEGDKIGERFIHRAGMKSADRDALIPTVGNRLLFSQSQNPMVRFFGSFLSWAQAKTTQTNALVSRVESGDGKLAVRMIGALAVYDQVRRLQLWLNPSEKYVQSVSMSDSLDIPDSFKIIGDRIIFSASVIPWYGDKAVNAMRRPDKNENFFTSLMPVLEMMNDLGGGAYTTAFARDQKDKISAFWGTKGVMQTAIPFYKDFEKWLQIEKRRKGEYTYSDLINPQGKEYIDTEERYKNFKGGEVSEENPVPNAAPEPSERINPYTGEPYESEMERLGFKDGGSGGKRIVGITEDGKYYLTNYGKGSILVKNAPKKLVDKWKRLQKKDGLLVSIGVAPVSDKEINKLKKSLKKRQAKRNGGKATRNYAKEYANYHSSEKQKKDRAHRNNANRKLKREGRIAKGDGKDVDHKDGNPRNNSPSNLTVKSKNTNRSFSRRLKARNGSLIKKAIKDYFKVEELKKEIREREGFREGAYKPDPTEEHYTIGYGFYDPNIKENDRMTREQAEERLDKEVNKRIEKIYKDIPGIINFSPSAQKALFSETYRGSLTAEGSPKTIALINEGRYMDAGKEFLNNDEYRNAEAKGIPGIRPRMEAVRDELFKMDAGFQKQQADFYQSVVPYGQQ